MKMAWSPMAALVGLALTISSIAFAADAPPTLAQVKEALEIQKLSAEVSKAEKDSRYFYVGYIAPGIAVVSGIAALVTIFMQRHTTLRVQKETERAALELKALEFVLNSPTPWIAAEKLDLIRRCYAHLLSKEFLTVTATIDAAELPGTRLHEMKIECFKQLASQCKTVEEVVAAAAAVFPYDEGRLIEKPERLRSASEGGAAKPGVRVAAAEEPER